MARLCIFIGEGLSDTSFIKSMLENKFGFQPLQAKDPNLFENNENIWFFPFPPGISCPTGGKGRLIKTENYRLAHQMALNMAKAYRISESDIRYIVLTDHIVVDKDGQTTRSVGIKNAYTNSGVRAAGIDVYFAENEIECWFFAGLKHSDPIFDRSKRTELIRILKLDPENISSPKAAISSTISSSLQGAQKIAHEVGRCFDIDLAKSRSKSFSIFMQGIEKNL